MEIPVDPADPDSELRPTKPLEFWKVNSCRFYILVEIARDAVSVAASSSSIERAFSTAFDIMSAKRNEIKPDLFANLMFIKCAVYDLEVYLKISFFSTDDSRKTEPHEAHVISFPTSTRIFKGRAESPEGPQWPSFELLLSKFLNKICALPVLAPMCFSPVYAVVVHVPELHDPVVRWKPKELRSVKAKYRALYGNEYNSFPALLFMLEKLLSKEVRNAIGECFADGTMYSVVWDRLDAVYDCTEVMDHTYLDDQLQIPPLKSQNASSVKTFVIAVRFDEKKQVKRPNATHTSTIGHVSTEEGSEETTSSPLLAAPMGRRQKTERKAAQKTDHWSCLACNGRAHYLASCIKIVPVRIGVGSRWVDTFRFLDTRSDTTLIRSDVVKKLGLVGQPKHINVVSYDGATSNVKAPVVTPNPPINPRQMEFWTHLRGLDVQNSQRENVGVLIGLDVAQAHDHIDSVKQPAGTIGPLAFKTPFGWCLDVKKFWKLEAKDVDMEQSVLSEYDLRGKRILESTVKHVGNRYQVGIMWKTNIVNLPVNRATALKRLYSLERRFQRDGAFTQKHDAVVKEYIGLYHDRLITTEELRKESIRVVFDEAAENGGTSINQSLLRRPNLLVSLLGVLLRFQMNLVMVVADREKMFHQVKVPVEDQAAYLFVYRTPGRSTTLWDSSLLWFSNEVTSARHLDVREKNRLADPIPEKLGRRFHYWYEHLENLELQKVTRCFRHQRGRCTQEHLHLYVFTDSSTKGFGAVAFFRFLFEDQSINVSFVMAKTHVTPVKGLTIPRLELQAALEGLNIALVICRELEYDLREVTFHTDSQTVLHLCSRRIDPKNVDELVKFHEGPSFLKLDPSEWDTWEEIAELEESDVKMIRGFAIKTEDENHPIEKIFQSSEDSESYRLVQEARDKCQSEDGHLQAHQEPGVASEVKPPHFQLFSERRRKVMKSVANNCLPCKRRSSKPIPPLVASLPVHRLPPYLLPFTYTIVDYFGPLTVQVSGRGCRHEKRWVCLFTCLTTRAVHLQVSEGLSLEEFLLCFTRFVSLRGKPNVVYSDNRTNLVAGKQELRPALMEVIQQHPELHLKLACQQIEWQYKSTAPDIEEFPYSVAHLYQSGLQLSQRPLILVPSIVNLLKALYFMEELIAVVYGRKLCQQRRLNSSDHQGPLYLNVIVKLVFAPPRCIYPPFRSDGSNSLRLPHPTRVVTAAATTEFLANLPLSNRVVTPEDIHQKASKSHSKPSSISSESELSSPSAHARGLPTRIILLAHLHSRPLDSRSLAQGYSGGFDGTAYNCLINPWRKSPKLVVSALSTPGSANTPIHLPPSDHSSKTRSSDGLKRPLTASRRTTLRPNPDFAIACKESLMLSLSCHTLIARHTAVAVASYPNNLRRVGQFGR
ncbi:Uncharacterized protein APZ42_013850 [Daphnia magna]|uniref:HAT C-terminal dimerisation domain-containing protein n=1 Tax=Daphnia magna TaxID=35525 RepID=A0A162QH48_9CRUS|nr:Uncharacterized protein APZ42_013850 [Daphnia magna]